MFILTKNMLISVTCSSLLLACGGNGNGPSENQQYPNLTQDEAIDLINNNGRIHNNDAAEITKNLEGWQVKNLAIYTLLAYDMSQQVNTVATHNNNLNIHNHPELFRHIFTNKEMGFNDSHFQGINNLNDLCDDIEGNSYNQFNVREDQFEDSTNNQNIRDVKIHGNIKLGECQFDYTEEDTTRKNVTHGDMTYEFDFKNTIDSNANQSLSTFQSKMHGKWLVSSETLGYKDNFGYWLIENLSALSHYNRSSSSTDVITSELRTDMYIRDAYSNWDHRYKVHLIDGNIKTKLGSQNPYSGKLELTTDSVGSSLIIEFGETSVDIYINGDRVYKNLSWTDLRATSLDI